MEQNKNGFSAFYSAKGIQNRVYLTRRGSFIGQIRYYTEKELPVDVRKQVRSNFYDYAITSVTEVNCNNLTAYLVTIADDTTWKVIRVLDGEMDVWKEYLKDKASLE